MGQEGDHREELGTLTRAWKHTETNEAEVGKRLETHGELGLSDMAEGRKGTSPFQ